MPDAMILTNYIVFGITFFLRIFFCFVILSKQTSTNVLSKKVEVKGFRFRTQITSGPIPAGLEGKIIDMVTNNLAKFNYQTKTGMGHLCWDVCGSWQLFLTRVFS